MKVLIFDDNKSRPWEIDAFAKAHPWLEVIEEQDPYELEDVLEGASAVFVHNSLGDNDDDDDLRKTREELPELCEKAGIACVRYSGAYMSDNEAYGQMSKANFFRRLPGALAQWDATGNVELGLLFHDAPAPAAAKAEPMQEGETVSPGADFDVNKADAYKALLAGGKRVEIDVDAMGPEKGLIAALMIRLWLPELREKALCPIVFRGTKDISEYARTPGRVPWQVLFCEGSAFNPKEGESTGGLRIEDFKSGFLDRIKIRPVEEAGNHTISNDWGAFLVGLFTTGATCRDGLFKRMSTNDPMYLLYTWLSAMSDEDLKELVAGTFFASVGKQERHKGPKEGNILLVDDQVDVWGDVMKNLLDRYRLTIIPRSEFTKVREDCYLRSAAKAEILSDKYDLILLDLRLGGAAEEELPEGEVFSGLKVLKEIHRQNPGQQVVMFTSSNKAWNLREALNYPGCAGYYIKESPATGNSLAEVRKDVEGLLTTIRRGMRRAYLKDVYTDICKMQERLENLCESDREYDFAYKEISTQLDIAFTMLYEAAQREESKSGNPDSYGPAFFAIEQVIEIMAQIWAPEDDDSIANRVIRYFDLYNTIGAKRTKELRDLIKVRNNFVHRNDDAEAINTEAYFLAMKDVISDIIFEAL